MTVIRFLLIQVSKISLNKFHFSSNAWIGRTIQTSELFSTYSRQIDVPVFKDSTTQETNAGNIKEDNDYFGIESDEGAICFEDAVPQLDKFKYLTEKKPKRVGDVVIPTSFGYIRRDSDNQLSDKETRLIINRSINRVLGRRSKLRSVNRDDTCSKDSFTSTATNVQEHLHENISSYGSDHNEVPCKVPKIKPRKLAGAQILPPEKLKSTNQNESSEENDLNYIDKSYFESDAIQQHSYSPILKQERNRENVQRQFPVDDSVPVHDSASVESANVQSVSEPYVCRQTQNLEPQVKKGFESDRRSECNEHGDGEPFVLHETPELPETVCETDLSDIDKQYFQPNGYTLNSHSNLEFLRDSTANKCVFSETDVHQSRVIGKNVELSTGKDKLELNSMEENLVVHNKQSDVDGNYPSEKMSPKRSLSSTVAELEKELSNSDGHSKSSDEREKKTNEENGSNRKSAFDFIKNLRKAKQPETLSGNVDIKLDSKGFRILTNQVQDLSTLTRDELLEQLKSRVLYSDDDLLVLDKPYNLVIHDAKSDKEPSLSVLLDDLAHMLDRQALNPKLITLHRLDKTTTGCLLLARNEMAAQYFKSLFAQRKITKTYWIVTAGVPEHTEGVIDIPIAEGSIGKKARMVLHPHLTEDTPYKPHCKRGKKAVTNYTVIATSGNAALIECRSETGLKHQIRVHFGFGLNCPIIGDHKYSHLDKLAPQKLPSDILQRLHIRQSKVRHIPMHIHARSIVIPNYLNERDFFVHAPLPSHMHKNLRSLKFKKK